MCFWCSSFERARPESFCTVNVNACLNALIIAIWVEWTRNTIGQHIFGYYLLIFKSEHYAPLSLKTLSWKLLTWSRWWGSWTWSWSTVWAKRCCWRRSSGGGEDIIHVIVVRRICCSFLILILAISLQGPKTRKQQTDKINRPIQHSCCFTKGLQRISDSNSSLHAFLFTVQTEQHVTLP